MAAPAGPHPRTSNVIVYIDGFNLYYGVLKSSKEKWLDIERFFRLLRPHDTIKKIKYFTALSGGGKSQDQRTYLKALETLPLVSVVLGRYKSKSLKCLVPTCEVESGGRFFKTQEEKRTDVNIAVAMLDDAYQALGDHLIVVSGDSDLVPAVNAVKFRFPHIKVTVYVPSRNPIRGAAVELRSAADQDRDLPLISSRLPNCHVLSPTGLEGLS